MRENKAIASFTLKSRYEHFLFILFFYSKNREKDARSFLVLMRRIGG